jgi:hypothetical protein
MDIRDILKSFDQLSEATTATDKGTVHKAGPGGYGNKHGTDDVTDQYGKPVGRVSLGKLGAQNEPKRGKGRPPNPDKAKSYDSSALSKAMGVGKAPKPTGKPSVKHSLKEYFDIMDEALSEAGLAVQPLPATPQQKQQQQMAGKPSFLIKDPANPSMPAITTQDPAVVQAAKNGTMSMQKPGAAPTTPGATPAAGAGSQVKPMEEDGEKWIQGAIKHPGAFTKKASSHGMTPKEFANKVLAHKKDYPAKTEKQAQLAKTLGKMHEAEAPQNFAQSSPLSTANRGVLEGKKPDANKNGIPDYAEDGKGKNDLKKKSDIDSKRKSQVAAAGKAFNDADEYKKFGGSSKKKVKEGMEHHLQAARLEGKSHALRKMPYNCTHDDMEEARHYHEGFKEGLDECYGQMPILGRTAVGEMGQGPEVDTMASYGADDLGEMDKSSYMKQQAIKTPGNTFKAFGQTMRDNDVLDEFAFESLDKQLNAILEGKEVSEGMTVSISKGQQGSPDSVSVSAQDGEADQLLSIIKSAGMGLFGGDEHNGYGAPQGSAGAHGGISVVDDHDGMMSLMKKLSGGEMQSGGDYADEEGSEQEHMHGEEGHSHEDEEADCNECGYMESKCQCDHGDEQVVDEVESRDQMAYEVAEANAPDSGAAETAADDASEAGEDAALATADAAQDEEEGQVYSSPTEGKEDTTGEEAGKEKVDEGTCKKCDCNPCKCETMSESSFFNLFRKIAMLSEESTSEKDDKAEKAGKKVAKDIEYDEDHKGKDDDKAEEAGKKVKKDIEYDDKKDKKEKKLDEWANEAGKNGTDAAFEADIDFMTKVISGGLNKQKSTGQTTVPVINGQHSRMGVDGLGSPMKESNDLLKDYKKLSGL